MFDSGRRRETRGYIQKPVGGNLGSGLGVSGTDAPHAVAEPISASEPCVTVVISLHSKMRSVPHLKRPQTSAEPSAPLARANSLPPGRPDADDDAEDVEDYDYENINSFLNDLHLAREHRRASVG